MHVVQSKRVCRETAYGNGLPSGHTLFTSSIDFAVIVSLVGGNCFAKIERGCRSGTTGILPLGLERQAVRLLVFFSQFLDEFLAIIPGHHFHWQVLFALEMAGILAGDLLPLFLGHGVNTHVETFSHHDFVLGFVTSPSPWNLPS